MILYMIVICCAMRPRHLEASSGLCFLSMLLNISTHMYITARSELRKRASHLIFLPLLEDASCFTLS